MAWWHEGRMKASKPKPKPKKPRIYAVSFASVYPLYMQREITRTHVRDVVQKGLEEARGNYKIMVQLFNMDAGDYKKFLNFLRKHECQLPFKEYRQITHV